LAIIGLLTFLLMGHVAVLGVGITIDDREGGLWIENDDGTNGRWIAAPSGLRSPAFSPDGRFIAWVSNCSPYRNPECDDSEILMMAVDGAGGYAPDVGLLAIDLPGDQSAPAWTPEGDLAFLDTNSPTRASIARMHYDEWLPHWKEVTAIEPTTQAGTAETVHADAHILHIGATADWWHGSGILLEPGETVTVYIGGKPCAHSSDSGTCGFQHLLVRHCINASGVRHEVTLLEMGDNLHWRYRNPGALEYTWATITAQHAGELEFSLWDPDGGFGNNGGTPFSGFDGYLLTILKDAGSRNRGYLPSRRNRRHARG